MENTQEKKQYNVEVVYVDKSRNTVDLQGEIEGQFEIVSPADIKWAKNGPATASLNAFGKICYLRSTAPKQPRTQGNVYQKNYSNNNYPKKQWNSASQSNPLTPASQYRPDRQERKEVDWDKISFGKVKYGFLIEAFKKGMPLEEAEIDAEKWTKASMRMLSEQDIVNKVIAKINTQNVNTQNDSQDEKQDFSDEAYSDELPEESLGYF